MTGPEFSRRYNFQIFSESDQESGNVVSHTHRPSGSQGHNAVGRIMAPLELNSRSPGL